MRTAVLGLLALLSGCVPRARPEDPVEWADVFRDCRHGDARACLWVGVAKQEHGALNAAMELYQQSCDAGVADACSQVADLVFHGTGRPPNQARGVKLAQAACEAGSATACHLVGVALYWGRGVEKDVSRSTQFYARACAAGDPSSCRDYAKALNEGRGVPVDVQRARALWRKTCPQEDLSCSLLAASLRGEDPAGALEVAREGCRNGGSTSCHRAGDWYFDARDLGTAARYLRAGCAWGEPSSCTYLGGVLRQMHPPLNEEAELVWTDACARGGQVACVRLTRYKMLRDGRSDALVAEMNAWCGADVTKNAAAKDVQAAAEACDWFCEDTKRDLASPVCVSACAKGAEDSCPKPKPALPP